MKVKCKDCGYVCSKSEAKALAIPDDKGICAKCPECDNKFFFRVSGPKHIITEDGKHVIHYK